MKIKEKLFIVSVFIVAFMSFTLPKTVISLQENSLVNQVNRLESDYFSTNNSEIYSIPVISDLEEFCNIFVSGEKNKAETIPTNEKSPLVLIELVQAEIAQLQEIGILPTVSFNVTDTPTPFVYTLGGNKTIVWEYSLIDEDDNTLTIAYHSGVEKIVGLDYHSLNFDIEEAKSDHIFSVDRYFSENPNDDNLNSFTPAKEPYILRLFDEISLLCKYSDTGFSFRFIESPNYFGAIEN